MQENFGLENQNLEENSGKKIEVWAQTPKISEPKYGKNRSLDPKTKNLEEKSGKIEVWARKPKIWETTNPEKKRSSDSEPKDWEIQEKN